MSVVTDRLIEELGYTVSRQRTRKMNVILFGGKAQVGKTTASDYLVDKLSTDTGILANRASLAEPIKINAMEFFEWDGQKDEKGRRLLQELGDAGRNFYEDIYAKKLEDNQLSNLFPNNFVVIDDWRYLNEAEYFKRNFLYQVTTVRIEKGSNLPGSLATHRSEVSLPVSEKENLVYNKGNIYNFEVHNSGTKEDYYNKLDSIVEYLKTYIISY